jgi:hypothetical protein
MLILPFGCCCSFTFPLSSEIVPSTALWAVGLGRCVIVPMIGWRRGPKITLPLSMLRFWPAAVAPSRSIGILNTVFVIWRIESVLRQWLVNCVALFCHNILLECIRRDFSEDLASTVCLVYSLR